MIFPLNQKVLFDFSKMHFICMLNITVLLINLIKQIDDIGKCLSLYFE